MKTFQREQMILPPLAAHFAELGHALLPALLTGSECTATAEGLPGYRRAGLRSRQALKIHARD